MIKVKALVASIALLSEMLVPSNAEAQEVRNVISSCHVETTAGVVDRGKCKIKTWVEGDYIIVEIRKSWKGYKEPDYFRLINNPNCRSWSGISKREDGCQAVSGDGQSWNEEEGGLVSIGEDESNKGNHQLYYTYGTAYTFFYHGILPKPSTPDIKVIK